MYEEIKVLGFVQCTKTREFLTPSLPPGPDKIVIFSSLGAGGNGTAEVQQTKELHNCFVTVK